MNRFSLSHLSDASLIRRAYEHTAVESSATAEQLADLAEIDARRSFRQEAYESLFDFCVRGLRLTEDAAKLRIRIARKCREVPALFPAIADGRLRLTAVDLLASRLTPENAAELIAAATHRTIAELRELLAARYPRPDVPERIEDLAAATVVQEMSSEGGLNPVAGHPSALLFGRSSTEAAEPVAARPRVEPLSAERFGIQCTIGRSTLEKLNYVKSLLGRGVPNGDLATVLDRALDALARELERRKYGITEHPRACTRRQSTNPRHIPAEVRRAVVARDGAQCTFVSDTGRRCEARDRLEFDHIEPVGRGGGATVGNLRLRCRAHNQFEAERTYGTEFMQHKREGARLVAEEARAKAEAEREKSAATARAKAAAEVIPWLRALGLRADESREAAALCERIPDAPIEERVRLALTCFAKPRLGRAMAIPQIAS